MSGGHGGWPLGDQPYGSPPPGNRTPKLPTSFEIEQDEEDEEFTPWCDPLSEYEKEERRREAKEASERFDRWIEGLEQKFRRWRSGLSWPAWLLLKAGELVFITIMGILFLCLVILMLLVFAKWCMS